MKVLLVNKFLYPKGGAETYTFKLGETLESHGHEVQYFGLENQKNIVEASIKGSKALSTIQYWYFHKKYSTM